MLRHRRIWLRRDALQPFIGCGQAEHIATSRRLFNERRVALQDGVAARKGSRYTSQDNETILRLLRQGYKWSAIANALGRPSGDSVWSYYARILRPVYGVHLAPMREKDKEENAGKIWSSTEDDILIAWAANPRSRKLASIARTIRRSPYATANRVMALKPFHRSPPQVAQREPFTTLQILTIVYLRQRSKTEWTELARLFPNRSLNSIKKMYYTSWRKRYGDVASDPREWSEEELSAFLLHRTHSSPTAKRSRNITLREALTVVYFRLRKRSTWAQIADLVPGHSCHTLLQRFSLRWRERYADVAERLPLRVYKTQGRRDPD
ncbi:hypothetical protein LTS10_007521 [Elasticomyces elasticus]|nr:hypothetical protein LTS10_007521 [Elasticomyces elasticus]